LVSALAAALACVEPPASYACPVSITRSLRIRYRDADLVAVARIGDSVAVERRSIVLVMDTALHITSLLKGAEKEKVVNLRQSILSLPSMNTAVKYEKDDVVLVFLKRIEKGEEYISIDDERGVQKLSDEDLKVYLRRIDELAAIMRSEEPDEAALTEWLVRCAEEPATRWEGAEELAFNVSLPEDPPDEEEDAAAESGEDRTSANDAAAGGDEQETEDESNSSAEPAAGVGESGKVEANDQQNVPPDYLSPNPEVNYAALLTPAQKERLTTALLSAEEIELGEQLLMILASSWKDERLVPFALKHLARMADKPPYHAEEMMRIVAHLLGDQTLIKFVANYRKTVDYDDLYDGTAAEAATYVEDPKATPGERAATEKEFEEMKAAAAEALFQRSGKLRHFLALADQPQKP
jgi:hypothetical protein